MAPMSARRVAPGPFVCDGICSSSSTKTSALPGATEPRSALTASSPAFERTSGSGSVTIASVPPPNIVAVATRSRMASGVASAPGRPPALETHVRALGRGDPRPELARGPLQAVAVVAPEVAEGGRHRRVAGWAPGGGLRAGRGRSRAAGARRPARPRRARRRPPRGARRDRRPRPGRPRPSPARPGSDWPTRRTGRASAPGAGRPACRRRRRSGPRGRPPRARPRTAARRRAG